MTEPGGQVVGFMSTAVVMCGCGRTTPLIVPFVTGGTMKSKCPDCGTSFHVIKISFDATVGGIPQLNVSLGVEAALIAPPGVVMPFGGRS